MHLDLLCLILFPLCLLPHPKTFFPLTKLLCLPQYPLSVFFLEAFHSPKGRRLWEGAPSPLGSHSLATPLPWCLAGCHPVPHLAPQTLACSRPAAPLLARGRGAAGVAPVCQHIPTPGLTFNHQEEEVVTPLRLWAYLLLPTATGCSVPFMGKGHDARISHTLPTQSPESSLDSLAPSSSFEPLAFTLVRQQLKSTFLSQW